MLGSNILIDENGYILEIITDNEDIDLPLLNGIETFSMVINERVETDNQELLEIFLEVLKSLKNNDMLTNIVKIEKNESVLLYTKGGHIVNIGDISDLNYKMLRLKAVLDKNDIVPLHIDVSNVNIWPVSKPLWN